MTPGAANQRLRRVRRLSEGGHVASEWTRAMLGTRSRLLTVVAVLLALVVVVPILLLVLRLAILAAASLVIGLIGFAVLVMALLPGRRRWR